jgi:hypothetical protein
VRVLGRRIGRNIHDVLKEDQLGMRSGKGTRDATGMLRISAERPLNIDEEMCTYFRDIINWTKLK